MQKTIIVVPVGEAGSGKDTVAKMLQKHLQVSSVTLAFASPLKDFAEQVFGFSAETLWGPSALREVPDARYDTGAAFQWEVAHANLLAEAPGFVAKAMSVLGEKRHADAYYSLCDWFQALRAEHSDKPLTPRRTLQTLGTEWGRALDSELWIRWFERRAEDLGNAVTVATDGRFINEAEIADYPVLVQRPNSTKTLAHASEQDQGSQAMVELCRTRGRVIVNDGTLEDLERQVASLATDIEGLVSQAA